MQSHIEKGKKNEKFLQFIELHGKDDYIDWKITVCFYSALHYVKAFLKKHSINTNNHKDIDDQIHFKNGGKAKFDQPHYEVYEDLRRNASVARYSGVFSTSFQEQYLKNLCIESKKSLHQIKLYIGSKGVKLD